MAARQQQTWPGDLELSELRRICQEVIDAIADYHADLCGRGIRPDVTPEEIRALFAEEFSEEGESAGVLLADWRGRVVPALTAIGGLRELFSKNFGLAEHLHNLVREHPDFEVLHEPTLYLYCFRYVPNGLAECQDEPGVQALLDGLNQGIVEAVERGGLALVMMTRIRGRVAIRMSGCSHRTQEEDIDATFEALARWGRLLSKNLSIHYVKPAETEASRCSSESCSSPTEVSAT
jgi:hypothetical protein